MKRKVKVEKDNLCKSISNGVQYVCNHAKTFFTSKVYFFNFFATPPIKLKPEQQIGGGVLIANHLDQSL
jgi:hypothetical protein